MSDLAQVNELEWIDGAFVYIGRRAISQAHRDFLLAHRRRARRRVLALVIGCFVPCFAGMALQSVLSPVNDWPMLVAICGPAMIAPFLIVFAVDSGRIGWLMRRNFADGHVKRYEVPEQLLYDLKVRRSLGMPVPPDLPHSIQTYAGTSHLADVGGEPVFRWMPVKPVCTARVPKTAADGLGMRSLELAETSELRRAARRMFGAEQIVVAGVRYGLLGLALVPLTRGFMPWWYLVIAVVVLLIAGILTVGMVQRFRHSRRMQADVLRGVVERLDEAATKEVATEGKEDVIPERVERLPESRMIWTVDGLPAFWRRTGM